MAPGGRSTAPLPTTRGRRVRSAKAELEHVVDDLVRGRWAGVPRPHRCWTCWRLSRSSPTEQFRDRGDDVAAGRARDHGHGLTWALAAIDQAPAVRAELESEWARRQPVSGRLPDRLPLTMAVLAETLRLWPPSWMFSRRVLEPLALGGRSSARGDDVPGQPGSAASRPTVVGRARTVPAGPLAATRAGATAASTPSVPASPAAPICPSGRDPDVYRGAIRLVGGRDDAGRDGPRLARPRTRCSADPGPSSMTLRPAVCAGDDAAALSAAAGQGAV